MAHFGAQEQNFVSDSGTDDIPIPTRSQYRFIARRGLGGVLGLALGGSVLGTAFGATFGKMAGSTGVTLAAILVFTFIFGGMFWIAALFKYLEAQQLNKRGRSVAGLVRSVDILDGADAGKAIVVVKPRTGANPAWFELDASQRLPEVGQIAFTTSVNTSSGSPALGYFKGRGWIRGGYQHEAQIESNRRQALSNPDDPEHGRLSIQEASGDNGGLSLQEGESGGLAVSSKAGGSQTAGTLKRQSERNDSAVEVESNS